MNDAKRALGFFGGDRWLLKILLFAGLLVLLFGTDDTNVRPKNSRNLVAAVTVAGGQAMVRIYPRMGHEGIIRALAHPFRGGGPVLAEAADFLRGVTARRAAIAAG